MTPNERLVFVQQPLQLFLHRGIGGRGGGGCRAALRFFYVGFTCLWYLGLCWEVESKLGMKLFVSVLISGFRQTHSSKYCSNLS